MWLANDHAALPEQVQPRSLDLDPDFATPWYQAEDSKTDHEHPIEVIAFPSIIDYSQVEWSFEAYGLRSSSGDFTTDVRLHARGSIEHPLSSDIEQLSLAIGIFDADDAQDAYQRLTKPPLQLTRDDLTRPQPEPQIVLNNNRILLERVPAGHTTKLGLNEDLGDITIRRTKLPILLLTAEAYQLTAPTAEDINIILERGGTPDLAALSRWLREHPNPPQFDAETRRAIMDNVRERFQHLRAPPALGDFHRLAALVAMIAAFGSSEDIEPLLELERPIKILHTSALLSYDMAIRDEAYLGLPVHGMRELPARSKFLEAPDAALKSLRAPALDRLLRLSFDPLDFRNAPTSYGDHRSHLASQAENLLAPLTQTDVVGILKACAQNHEVEREVLRFYIDVRHTPVVEHLVDWLTLHPEAIDDLGMFAIRSIPDALLPALMHHYIDPKDPTYRPLMRKMLEALPERLIPKLYQMLRSVGLQIKDPERGKPAQQIADALDHFERVERILATQRAAEIEQQLLDVGDDVASLRSSMRLIERLGQLSPPLVEKHADFLISLLEKIAWEFEIDSPAERTKALGLLTHMPWGTHQEDAIRRLAITEAKLIRRRGEYQPALEHLLAFDEHLIHPETRAAFIDLLLEQFQVELADGAFGGAAETLELAETLIHDDIDLPRLQGELMWAQYKPAFILGGAFLLALVSTVTWLVSSMIFASLRRWRDAVKARRLLDRRRADADANNQHAAHFSDDDFPEVPTVMDGTPSEENEHSAAPEENGEAQPDADAGLEHDDSESDDPKNDDELLDSSPPPSDTEATVISPDESPSDDASDKPANDARSGDDSPHADISALEDDDPFSDPFADSPFDDDFDWDEPEDPQEPQESETS